MKSHKTYFSVGVGKSTDMQYHPAPSFTCGHKHRTPASAEKCQEKLLGYVAKSETTNSGWRGMNDELAGME